ncbi:Similar to S.cerevisiae protein YGR125W (Putative protein of unknown function) [Malassezia sympodialis ATCC 42132]|uniref:SLC26A/SulP transporter domain-containing protein n=1 Tax=Malassezia sympodialis (strain ATCC 42132) TaxID=1230383 RepID=A0A1M8A412_MALS4|nr:Similar to S.cerevisiae protein YGR125W (Putative protein of unknown function) [Malassezia sympodialis ATCC 42132]
MTPMPLPRPKEFHISYAAVLLGFLSNVLDAASMGLLVFPANGTMFEGLQAQSIAMFVASIVVCQSVFVLGGTNFSQSQGSMLVEVLPFMQNIATKLATVIPDNRDALLATIVVAYALSALVLGALFLSLGFFQIDRWIAYFPETVLDGALGAIGLSLFLSGFEVAQRSSFEWTGEYLKSLFTSKGMPVVVSALVLTAMLCSGIRVKKRSGSTKPRWNTSFIRRLDWEFRQMCSNPFFTPAFNLTVGIVFWIIALISRSSMQSLVEHHWLFVTVPKGATLGSRMRFYEFWGLYKFHQVQWSALNEVIVEMIVLIIIGALNLPIYYPALVENLPDVPRTASIKKEFIGHGIANILAGLCGALPVLVVMSNTLFFARAYGRKSDSVLVLFVTFLFFVFSKLLLPYIPVLCAALMVFFFGVELMAEALVPTWSTKSLLEYMVILGTMAACTALGFAQGVGVGLAATLAAQGFEHLADYEIRTCFVDLSTFVDAHVLSPKVLERLTDNQDQSPQIGVIALSGTTSYTAASKIKQAIHTVQQHGCAALVIDLTFTVRIDRVAATAIAVERSNTHDGVSNHPPGFLLGVPTGSPRYEILAQSGVVCRDPSVVDAVTANQMIARSVWPMGEFSHVLAWLSAKATVTHPRLPRWARESQTPIAMPSPVREVSMSRRESYEIPLTPLPNIPPGMDTIDSTLPLSTQWQACWDQLCCSVQSDAVSMVAKDLKDSESFDESEMGPVSPKETLTWANRFVPVLEKFGHLSFYEPRTNLANSTDTMPDVRIIVVGCMNSRSNVTRISTSPHASASSPASKVDRSPADWASLRPRLRRRHTDSEMDTSGTKTVVEAFSQGDVVGLSELTFGEPWSMDLTTAGHLGSSCITIDFSAADVLNNAELAMALNTYNSHNHFRIHRIQDIYFQALGQGEQYKW